MQKINFGPKKFSIKDFFGKCDRIRRKLRIWSHLLEKIVHGKDFFVQYVKQKKANDKSCVGHFVTRFFIIIRQTSFSRQQWKHVHLGSSLINIFSIKLQSDSLQYEGVMQWRCYEKALAIDFYCIFSNNLHTHQLE